VSWRGREVEEGGVTVCSSLDGKNWCGEKGGDDGAQRFLKQSWRHGAVGGGERVRLGSTAWRREKGGRQRPDRGGRTRHVGGTVRCGIVEGEGGRPVWSGDSASWHGSNGIQAVSNRFHAN
jgi:hypothetical protein